MNVSYKRIKQTAWLICLIAFLLSALPDRAVAQQGHRRQVGADITKCEKGWLPGFGNITTFTARVYERDQRTGECKYPGPPGILHFALLNVSHERGYCLNKGFYRASDLYFPKQENEEKFNMDLLIREGCDMVNTSLGQGNVHEHYFHVYTKKCVTEAEVKVKSEDFGSFGVIKAWVTYPPDCTLPDDTEVVTYERREPGGPPNCNVAEAKTEIPRDDNGNHIADGWPGDTTGGNSDPAWDEEDQPNTDATAKGDGLTRYEEYRGFYVYTADKKAEQHNRLRPTRKELLMYLSTYPARKASELSSVVDVYYVSPDGMNGTLPDKDTSGNLVNGTQNPSKGPRIVNFNRTSHTKVDQHGLWVVAEGGDGKPGNWGLARDNNNGLTEPPGPPKTAGRIEVYVNNIALACAPVAQQPSDANYLGNPYQFHSDGSKRQNEFIEDAIAHEAGHGINLRHHKKKKVAIDHAPPWRLGWFALPGVPGNIDREWHSNDDQTDCYMAYYFRHIFDAVALYLGKDANNNPLWKSRNYEWSKGGGDPDPVTGKKQAPVTGHDVFGNTCKVEDGGDPCRKRIKISDN
ncbi:MAG: hypothetical protein AB1631_13845 [Acidobacteriota bacterium]